MATDIWMSLQGMVPLRRLEPGFPWPALEDQVRGVLAAFTGISCRGHLREEDQ